jgi:hypothetical protein
MKEKYIGDDDTTIIFDLTLGYGRLHSLSGAGADAVQDTGTHETSICGRSCAPYHTTQTNYRAPNQNRTSSEIGRDRDPNEIGEPKDKNTYTSLSSDL